RCSTGTSSPPSSACSAPVTPWSGAGPTCWPAGRPGRPRRSAPPRPPWKRFHDGAALPPPLARVGHLRRRGRLPVRGPAPPAAPRLALRPGLHRRRAGLRPAVLPDLLRPQRVRPGRGGGGPGAVPGGGVPERGRAERPAAADGGAPALPDGAGDGADQD